MGVFTTSKAWQLGLNITQQWWLSGASIDLDFDSNRYYDSSLAAGSQPLAILSNYLSITRASTGYAKTAAGTLNSFASNQLRRTDLGLLVEDARTNNVISSQVFSSVWGINFATATDNATAAPDGTTTAASVINAATGSIHALFNGFTAITSGAVSFSCYFKAGAFGFGYLSALENNATNRYGIVFNIATGAITSTQTDGTLTGTATASVEMLGNGWVRAVIVLSAGGGSNIQFGGLNTGTPTWDSGGNHPISTGDGSSGIYIWGAQAEAGAFPSSYIPTTGTSATRAADQVTLIGTLNTLAAALPRSEVADVISRSTTALYYICADDTGAVSDLQTAAGNNTQVGSVQAGVGLSANFASGGWLTGAKVGVALASGARSLVGQGGVVATDNNASTGHSGAIALGCQGNVNFGFITIRRFTVWNSKLADATLQALTV